VAAKWLFWQVLAHAKAADPNLPFNASEVTAHSTTAVRYLTDCGVASDTPEDGRSTRRERLPRPESPTQFKCTRTRLRPQPDAVYRHNVVSCRDSRFTWAVGCPFEVQVDLSDILAAEVDDLLTMTLGIVDL
jgi:hypothetical protein